MSVAQRLDDLLGRHMTRRCHNLHQLCQKHGDKIGCALLGLSEVSSSREDTAISSGKRAWDDVCHLLVETNDAMSGPTLSDMPASQHAVFRALMIKHGHRNMDSVRHIFQSVMASAVSHLHNHDNSDS